MTASFSINAAASPQFVDFLDVAAGYGVISVPVTDLLPGDTVDSASIAIEGTGLTTISATIDFVQRAQGYIQYQDDATVSLFFSLTAAQLALIGAATDCTYEVSLAVTRSENSYTREVQTGNIGVRDALPSSPLIVASIDINGGPVIAEIGDSVQLTATPLDGFGNAVIGAVVAWTSSDESIATVSSTGLVTVVALGTCTITATSYGISAYTTASATSAPWAIGDLIYAQTSSQLAGLAIGTPFQVLRVNAGATAPEWDTLTAADVGAGTFPGAYTFAGNVTMAALTTLAAQAVTATTFAASSTGHFGGDFDVGTTLFTVAAASGNTHVGGTLGVTGAVTLTAALTLANGGTGLTSYSVGDLPYFAAGTAFSKLAIGTAGQFLSSTGTAPAWTTAAFPLTAAAGDMLYASATNTWSNRIIGSANAMLQVSGGFPTWTLTPAGLTSIGATTGTFTNVGGTLSTAAQPNITSVGVLVSPHMTGAVVDSGGLTVTAGGLTVSAGTTAVQALTSTTFSASGLVQANAGLTVASGQTLTVSGVTITGLTAASVGAGTFPTGSYVFNSGNVTLTSGNVVVTSGNITFSANDSILGFSLNNIKFNNSTDTVTINNRDGTAGLTVSGIGHNVAITGTVTGGTYNSQTITSAASFTGTLTTASTLTVTTGGLTVSAGTTAVQAFTATTGGFSSTVTGGTYNGQTVSSAANFTGTMTIASTLTVNNGGSGIIAALGGQITATAVNAGSGAAFLAKSTSPYIAWQDTDGSSNNKYWDIGATDTTLTFRLVNDANDNAAAWMTVTRNQITPVSVAFGTLAVSGITTLATSGQYSASGEIGMLNSSKVWWGDNTAYINRSANNLQIVAPSLIDLQASTKVSAGGLQLGAPTGGDLGTGKLNVAGDIYKNNTAYTNPDYVFEAYFTRDVKRFIENDGAQEFRDAFIERGGRLLSIVEDREFAREHLHLPTVPRHPTGMFERGDVALREIETTRAYVWELQDEINDLKRQIAELKEAA